jgi:hypothetical protein
MAAVIAATDYRNTLVEVALAFLCFEIPANPGSQLLQVSCVILLIWELLPNLSQDTANPFFDCPFDAGR